MALSISAVYAALLGIAARADATAELVDVHHGTPIVNSSPAPPLLYAFFVPPPLYAFLISLIVVGLAHRLDRLIQRDALVPDAWLV
jgi:hypothetical protein